MSLLELLYGPPRPGFVAIILGFVTLWIINVTARVTSKYIFTWLEPKRPGPKIPNTRAPLIGEQLPRPVQVPPADQGPNAN